MKIFKNIPTNKKKAFTLIELIVTVSIVSVIMSIILFGYASFNDNLTVSSANQEISLAIRQAQTYGLSVKETGSGDFTRGYGVSFSSVLADQTSYYIFVDTNANGKNDNATGACTGECVEKVTLRNGVKISSVCYSVLVTDTPVCTSVTSLHILFIRPNPDAIIRMYNGLTQVGTTHYRGQVRLTSTKGKVGTITVEKTGQIYVQ